MATKKGTNKSETLKGTNSDDILLGLAGNDTLYGGEGNDKLNGGAGDDELLGGNGNDLFLPGQGGADAMDGGKGIDTVSYANFSTTVGIRIEIYAVGQTSLDDSAGDTFFSVERFIGSDASDYFYINRPEAGLKPYVFGGDGEDNIHIFNGVARGGAGNDTLTADGGVFVETFWLERDGGTDSIGNFRGTQDKLRISGEEFGIGAMLNSDELFSSFSSASPTGTKAQFIFRSDEDQLFFDPDGTGSEAAVLLVDFRDSSQISSLTVEDFQIV